MSRISTILEEEGLTPPKLISVRMPPKKHSKEERIGALQGLTKGLVIRNDTGKPLPIHGPQGTFGMSALLLPHETLKITRVVQSGERIRGFFAKGGHTAYKGEADPSSFYWHPTEKWQQLSPGLWILRNEGEIEHVVGQNFAGTMTIADVLLSAEAS